MQQVRDTFAVMFFLVWICVGVGAMFFMYNNFNLSSEMGPGGRSEIREEQFEKRQMMQEGGQAGEKEFQTGKKVSPEMKTDN